MGESKYIVMKEFKVGIFFVFWNVFMFCLQIEVLVCILFKVDYILN